MNPRSIVFLGNSNRVTKKRRNFADTYPLFQETNRERCPKPMTMTLNNPRENKELMKSPMIMPRN